MSPGWTGRHPNSSRVSTLDAGLKLMSEPPAPG